MTHEQAIWYWLRLSLVEKQRATRRMLEDGRVALNEQMDLVPTAGEFRERVGDYKC
jgi:hypothetical protein